MRDLCIATQQLRFSAFISVNKELMSNDCTKMIETLKYYLGITGVRGLLTAIKAKLSSETIIHRLHNKTIGSDVFLRIPSSDVSTYGQVFLSSEYDFECVNDPQFIIDAGANIGLVSILFASRFPKAKIIAIEPESGNYEMLKKNTESYNNIYPMQAALWMENKPINLIDPQHGNWGFWGFMTDDLDNNKPLTGIAKSVVQGRTLDKIMDQYNCQKVDILKIDIEGAEREVFSAIFKVLMPSHNSITALQTPCSTNH